MIVKTKITVISLAIMCSGNTIVTSSRQNQHAEHYTHWRCKGERGR